MHTLFFIYALHFCKEKFQSLIVSCSSITSELFFKKKSCHLYRVIFTLYRSSEVHVTVISRSLLSL